MGTGDCPIRLPNCPNCRIVPMTPAPSQRERAIQANPPDRISIPQLLQTLFVSHVTRESPLHSGLSGGYAGPQHRSWPSADPTEFRRLLRPPSHDCDVLGECREGTLQSIERGMQNAQRIRSTMFAAPDSGNETSRIRKTGDSAKRIRCANPSNRTRSDVRTGLTKRTWRRPCPCRLLLLMKKNITSGIVLCVVCRPFPDRNRGKSPSTFGRGRIAPMNHSLLRRVIASLLQRNVSRDNFLNAAV